MAITKLNSLAIPANTVVAADLSYPLTNFSSTGIDDNADATAITISSAEDVGIGATPNNYSDYVTLTLDGTQGAAIDIEKDGTVQAEWWTYRNSPDVAFAAAHASGSIRLMAGGFTERARIQAGGGISFNGDTAAANALDDYEEGTWTPTYVSSSGSFGSLSYGTRAGHYTKIGDLVTVHCRLDTSSMSIGSASGYLLVGGMPFAAHNSAYQSITIGYSYNFSSVWPTAGSTGHGMSAFYLYNTDTRANSESIYASNLGTSSTNLYLSATYKTN